LAIVQGASRAAIAINQIAIVASFITFHRAIAADVDFHTRPVAIDVAEPGLAIGAVIARSVIFQFTICGATVAGGRISVVTDLGAFEYAVAASIRWLALVAVGGVTNLSRTVCIIRAVSVWPKCADVGATVVVHGISIVANLRAFLLAVGATVDRRAFSASPMIAHAGVALRTQTTRFTIPTQTSVAACIRIDVVAVVADF